MNAPNSHCDCHQEWVGSRHAHDPVSAVGDHRTDRRAVDSSRGWNQPWHRRWESRLLLRFAAACERRRCGLLCHRVGGRTHGLNPSIPSGRVTVPVPERLASSRAGVDAVVAGLQYGYFPSVGFGMLTVLVRTVGFCAQHHGQHRGLVACPVLSCEPLARCCFR